MFHHQLCHLLGRICAIDRVLFWEEIQLFGRDRAFRYFYNDLIQQYDLTSDISQFARSTLHILSHCNGQPNQYVTMFYLVIVYVCLDNMCKFFLTMFYLVVVNVCLQNMCIPNAGVLFVLPDFGFTLLSLSGLLLSKANRP